MVEKKNTVQILSNVLLSVRGQNLIVTATDLEVGIHIELTLEQPAEDGRIAIAAKSIADIVKEFPEALVSLETKENNWFEISCLKSKFNIVGLNAEEYPSLPSFSETAYFRMPSARLSEMIDRTSFAASTDETRYQMNGVFLEALNDQFVRMVSTDGHRLVTYDKEFSAVSVAPIQAGIIIPRKGLVELRRLLDGHDGEFEFGFQRNNLLVKLVDIRLFVRLIDGEYPDYRKVQPEKFNKKLTVSREAFLGSLRRMSLLANEKSRGVKILMAPTQMTLMSSNPDLGEAREDLDVEYEGEPLEIGFNAKYLIECLSNLDCESVSLNLTDRLSAGVLRPAGKDDFTYVVMPMRI